MKSVASGGSRDKGRGQRASAGNSSGMGGGQIMTENSRTSPGRVDRGRGRGARGSEKRPTLVQVRSQEEMNDFDRYALITARRKTFETSTTLLCQELWATSRIIPGYGPPPLAAAQESLERVPEEPERPLPTAASAGPELTPSKKKTRKATARQLPLDDEPSPLAQNSNVGDH